MFSRCLIIDCLRRFCWVNSRGFAHMAALGLVSMIEHYVSVKNVVLVGLTGMHRTGCSGEARLVLHILPRHELENVKLSMVILHYDQFWGQVSCTYYAAIVTE